MFYIKSSVKWTSDSSVMIEIKLWREFANHCYKLSLLVI